VRPQGRTASHADHALPRASYRQWWNDELVARVRRGELPGVTFEGIVGKAGDGHGLVMAKAKGRSVGAPHPRALRRGRGPRHRRQLTRLAGSVRTVVTGVARNGCTPLPHQAHGVRALAPRNERTAFAAVGFR